MRTRRQFLRLAVIGTGALGVAAAACQPRDTSFACTDTSGLSDDDRKARALLAYADRAADPTKPCESCQQFIAAGDGCGTCKVLRGPIHPLGGCKGFAARG